MADNGASKLGEETEYQYDDPDYHMLDTFIQYGDVLESVRFTCTEMTSLCPRTGQPDFGYLQIIYNPKQRYHEGSSYYYCIESKSLKLYLFAFRNYQGFAEQIVQKVCNDCFNTCMPNHLSVTGEFNIRGGIGITAEARRFL